MEPEEALSESDERRSVSTGSTTDKGPDSIHTTRVVATGGWLVGEKTLKTRSSDENDINNNNNEIAVTWAESGENQDGIRKRQNVHPSENVKDEETPETAPDEQGGGEEGDGDDKELIQEENLAPSIFSLMFISQVWSSSLYALCVFALQVSMVITAFVSSIDLSSSSNIAKIPPGVPIGVTVTQALVIPLAVATQNDFIEAVVRFNDRGFEGDKGIHRLLNVSSPTYKKWLISSSAQLLVGIGLLITIFLFTMQSETVYAVLVNFAALFMISNISAVTFRVANRGFCGSAIWKETVKVTKYKVVRTYRSTLGLQALYVVVTLAFFAGYGVIVHKQLTGYYLCKSVYIQFDDSYRLNLPYLSGVYTIMAQSDRIASRYTYADDLTKASFMVAYCSNKESWGMSPHVVAASKEGAGDPCALDVLSQETESFDVTDTKESPWRVFSARDNGLVNTESFRMTCVDCDTSSCQPERGVCRDNKCECKDGRFGIHCQFREPCEQLVLDASQGKFPPIPSLINQDHVVLDSNYTLLRDSKGEIALAYHRPVYVSPGLEYVMMFTGRRWVIISPQLVAEAELDKAVPEEDMKEFFLTLIKYNHLYDTLGHPKLQQFVVSEPVESGSPIDQGSPIGLHWMGTRVVRRSASSSVLAPDSMELYKPRFICSICEDGINECDHFGTCNNKTKTCNCITGTVGFPLYTGVLCEKEVTCTDVKRDHGDLLPTGCAGGYTCQANGVCDCMDLVGPESGNFCQFLPCYEKSIQAKYPGGCANNGTCSNVTGSCTCIQGMFEGKYCQDPMAACYEQSAMVMYPSGGCANNGTCNNATGSCFCEVNMFEGKYCQRKLANCFEPLVQALYPGGCANNGTCNNETGSCACEDAMFGGKYCEKLVEDTV